MSRIIGIDFGNTSSSVAIMENGKSHIIATIPSVVAFTENDEILVGESAKRQALTNPKNTIYGIKHFLGRRFSDVDIMFNPYKIVKSDNSDAWIEVLGKKKSFPEICAEILFHLKTTAEDYLGKEVFEAVISVPAYFNNIQRQAIQDAGEIAGLDIKRLIHETSASAMAFGLDKQEGYRKIAVYNLGSGGFNVSIIEIVDLDGENQFEVLLASGSFLLSGDSIDNIIISHISNEFKKEYGFHLNIDESVLLRLKDASEKAKIELSSSQQTEINLPYIMVDASGPRHFQIKITRSKLENLVDDLIDKTIKLCQTAVRDAGIDFFDIQDVILVGEMTRMPIIQEKIKGYFGKEPRKDFNRKEIVASGLAIQAGVYEGIIKNVLLLDVTPLSLGVETVDGVMTKLIEKNTTIPTRKSQTFSTAEDNQNAVRIHALQGERELAKDNTSLGQFNLNGIIPAPRGVPQIEVTFDIDPNGILHVSAKDKATNQQKTITITGKSGLSKNEIENLAKSFSQRNKSINQNFLSDEHIHQLKQLQSLKDAGILTQDEFNAKKKLILGL